MGFKDINLGDPVDKLIETLGAPDTIDTATDEETGEDVPDTVFISYSNASFEVVDGKVTSIKTHFPNRKELARKKA